MNEGGPKVSKVQGSVPAGTKIIENVRNSLEELFFIENPRFKKRTPENGVAIDQFIEAHKGDDCWIYFPWRALAVHTVSEEIYFRLRTSRNRDVITTDEQSKYRGLTIGVAGLSVGSAIVSAVVASGGPKTMKIADFDTIEITNLNRLRADLMDIGSNKAEVAAHGVWELDPFADIYLFDQGVSRENLESFVIGEPRLDVFIDEMDSLDLKILGRLICKANKIPVLMATDNGDGIILDVERFDLEPDRAMFHGLIPEMKPEDLKNLDFKQWLQLATKIVGPEYLTESMQSSLLEIGKTIPAVPQLGTSATMAGSAMSFVLRKIATGEPMPSGRYTMSLEEKLVPRYNEPEEVAKRKKKTEDFLGSFGKQ